MPAAPRADEAALTRALQERGLIVLDVAPAEKNKAPASCNWGRARKQDVLEVTRALAALLPAGLPLARALEAATHVAPGTTAAAIAAVQARVELVGSSVEAVLAQRLVRKVCAACGEWSEVEAAGPHGAVFRGRGCAACWGPEYHGRTGIYELLVMEKTSGRQSRSSGRPRRSATSRSWRACARSGTTPSASSARG